MGATKLYVIMTAKKIHCLNHITGPVTTPTEMPMVDALDLVKNGFEVYEVNPYNKKERVKVTPYNYNSIMFKTTLSDMIARKKLNRELQNMDKETAKEVKEEAKEAKKEEPLVVTPLETTHPAAEKKEDKKKEDQPKKDDPKKDKENDKKVETEENKHQKISHTDFEKH